MNEILLNNGEGAGHRYKVQGGSVSDQFSNRCVPVIEHRPYARYWFKHQKCKLHLQKP